MKLSDRMQLASMPGTLFFAGMALTLTEMALCQDVRPAFDVSELIGEFWPEKESVDDFITAVCAWRRDEWQD